MKPSFLLARILAFLSIVSVALIPVAALLYPLAVVLAWLVLAWAFGLIARAEARSVRRERRAIVKPQAGPWVYVGGADAPKFENGFHNASGVDFKGVGP